MITEAELNFKELHCEKPDLNNLADIQTDKKCKISLTIWSFHSADRAQTANYPRCIPSYVAYVISVFPLVKTFVGLTMSHWMCNIVT